MRDNNYDVLFDLCRKGLITNEVLASIINEHNISRLDMPLDLYEKDLITKEKLADVINEYVSSKQNFTPKDEREKLAEANRKKAEENRKRVGEIEEKYRQEYITKQRDKEIENMTEFLLNVEDSRGRRVYSLADVKAMGYVEMFSLYYQIKEAMEKHDNKKMHDRHFEMSTDIPSIDNNLSNVFAEEKIAEPEINNYFKPASDLIEEPKAIEIEKEEQSTLTPPVIDNYFKPAGELDEEKSLESKEEMHSYTPPVMDNYFKPAGDILDDFDKEETYEKAKESAFSKEESSSVGPIAEPTEERKEKLKKSKKKVKNKFLGAVTVVASFTLVTLAAGPIFGIGSFLAFRHAVNTGKWNPDGKYLNYIKDNLEWMLNRNSKSKEEVGGRSK